MKDTKIYRRKACAFDSLTAKDGILMRNPKFELVPKKERILK